MALTRYEPVDLWARMQQQLNDMWRGTSELETSNVATSNWMPLVDIKEESNRFLIKADIPGVKPEAIEVTMESGALTIRGERSEEKREKNNGYHRIERSHGSFYRRFAMPDTADAEHIKATSKDGVLEIEIPKRAIAQPRKIEVKN
ncbi:MAG: Hsp20/alpha crystallin family protein [Gammaproteobacteria bacterium]|nr:Hsp20/alpha crystallin family protein [Gammaproteobacteria bacterium]